MKLKLLPIIIASMAIVACDNSEPSSSSSSSGSDSSSSQVATWEYLDFISGNKNARIDIFDFEDGLQVSYGNVALSNDVNNIALNDNALLSVNKNLAHEKSFNTLIVAESKTNGEDHLYKQFYLGTEGDSITSLFDIINNRLVGYQRAYVAFSVGTPAKWTHGLNAKLDTYFETVTTNAQD